MFLNIKEINAIELADWLQEGDSPFRVIDVREMREITGGTIPGAEPMPLATVPLRTNELAPQEKLVFVCHSGARSAQACAYLQQKGYSNVYNLRGGIVGWAASGMPALPPSTNPY
ncbi:rhodanese-like domain-containing protein [Kaarinaea lacus]